jgi:excisionase family DNA binding protein
MTAMEPLVVTVGEAADLLRISRAKAYRLAATGELPTVRVGATLRVPLEGLKEYVRERQRGGEVAR